MANLSKQRRERMLDFLEKIKIKNKDDEDSLVAINEIENELTEKKFGLVWEQHSEEVEDRMVEEVPVFVEDMDREISLGGDSKYNFILEGDNLHSLHLLEKCLKERVDIIYADPPYNTGAKDWKYNNDFVDSNDTYRHSKWLSFIAHRLKIAKNLLSENGVLIITIDDNEQEHLGLLLEEIFPDKKRTCVTIVHNPSGVQGNDFSATHEYAYFVYPANSGAIALQRRSETDSDKRNFRDVTGSSSLRTAAKNCFYPILVKDGGIIGFGDVLDKDVHPENVNVVRDDGVIEVYPIDPQGVERKWRFARQTVEAIQGELKANYIAKRKIWDIQRVKNYFPYKTVWTDPKYSANNYGTQPLNKMFEDNDTFPYSKSIHAVKECISAVTHDKDDAIILDFFAGSGTTGQAVLELNKEDGGHRSFILCTNNEISGKQKLRYLHANNLMLDFEPGNNANNDTINSKIDAFLEGKDDLCQKLFIDNKTEFEKYGICQSVTYPRIRTVVTGVNVKNHKYGDAIPANVKYYKTGFVPKNNDSLTDDLIDRVDEMIQLEFGVKIDKDKYISILSDDEADELELSWNNFPNLEAIYVSRRVLLTGKQKELFNTKNVYTIPDYYFRDELREAGEA